MKKFFVVLLSLVCLMSFTACDQPHSSPEELSNSEKVLLTEMDATMTLARKEQQEAFNEVDNTDNEGFGTYSITLKKPITVSNGVKLEKVVIKEELSLTSGGSATMNIVWISQIDNKRHEFIATMRMPASEMDKENPNITQTATLDGKTVNIPMEGEEPTPGPDVNPDIKPSTQALLEEAMQIPESLYTEGHEEKLIENGTETTHTIKLSEPVLLSNGTKVLELNQKEIMSGNTISMTMHMSWISAIDHATHILDLEASATIDELNSGVALPATGTLDEVPISINL